MSPHDLPAAAAPEGAPPASRATALDRVALVVASWFGSGLSPFAPGTAGTLATLPLYLILAHTLGTWAYVAVTLAVIVIGTWAADRASRRMGLKDPGLVVVDETAGFLVTMTALEPHPVTITLGFLVFRALDIVKPLGIRRLERLPGGIGIMMDDLGAGILGNVLLRLAVAAIPTTLE